MASVGDVFRIRGCQVLLGEELCNVFYYLVSLWTGNVTIGQVVATFNSDVVGEILNGQTDDIQWVEIVGDNLNDADEFKELIISRFGGIVDNVMPAYIAAGVQLVRTTKQTRHGAKRFAGMAESNWVDGVWTPPAPTVTALQDACLVELEFDDLAGNAFTLVPVIVGTDPITGLPDPGRTNLISDAVVRRGTTQNSRKGY